MRVAVIGGTGIVGQWTVRALRERGHEALAVSRSTGVDVATGAGLAGALEGAGAVVDATSVAATKRKAAVDFFDAAARSLTAAAKAAGVGHVVVISIVGIEDVPLGYYQGKLAQEAALERSGVPVSILRATQFHEFAGQFLERSARRTVVVPRWSAEPVAAREAGATLAALATGDPVDGRRELGGPRVESMADLVRRTAEARGEHRRVVEVPVPGRLGRALAAGRGIPGPQVPRGTQTFDDWLAERYPAGGAR